MRDTHHIPFRLFVGTFQRILYPGLKVPPRAPWREAMSALGKLEEFRIPRGSKSLSCLLIRRPGPRRSRRKVAILAHPISRKAKYWFSEGRRLRVYHSLGYDALVFDYNGFGESDRIDFYYWQDPRAVIRHVRGMGGVDHVVLHGVSFGSFHSLRAIPELPVGSSVVIENPPKSLFAYWKHWFHTRQIVRFFSRLNYGPVQDMDLAQALANLTRTDLSLLMIACGRDAFAPVEDMRELASHLRVPHRFEVFPDAEHMKAPEVEFERYETLIEEVAGRARGG